VSARRHASAAGRSAKGPAARAKCPICGKPRIEAFRPFCSKRCADVDLGRWLGGRYAVPGEPAAAKDENETENGR
jgi:endogenous inhibitor of DNA gyrase (YacG/DUF329 family)